MAFKKYYKTLALSQMYGVNQVIRRTLGKELVAIETTGTRSDRVELRIESEDGKYFEQLAVTNWEGLSHYLKGMSDFAYLVGEDEL